MPMYGAGFCALFGREKTVNLFEILVGESKEFIYLMKIQQFYGIFV
jgi:hypothetical protein